MQSQANEVQALASDARTCARGGLHQDLSRLLPHGSTRDLDLHEARARARQGAFKQLECIVVIEDFDRVRQGDNLLRTHLLLLLVHSLLGAAVLLEVRQKLLVLLEALRHILEVVLHGSDGDTQLGNPLELLLDGLGQRSDLLLLGRHKSLEGLHRLLLRGLHLLDVRLHLIPHLLQNADHLATDRGVPVSTGEEGHDLLTISLHHVLALHQRAQGARR
mmetsp:Transcript_30451/g.87851  ORF Transcript_30451/g.87851 Transcript_30451/m.87851 type:complete len:219 (+) Transcript_30451:871-1527(+)